MTTIPPKLPDPQLPVFARASADDAGSGASFAALLDQMLGGDEPAGQIDAGDARVAHFKGAEMFGEDGLFRGALWGGPARMPKTSLIPGDAAPIATALASIEPQSATIAIDTASTTQADDGDPLALSASGSTAETGATITATRVVNNAHPMEDVEIEPVLLSKDAPASPLAAETQDGSSTIGGGQKSAIDDARSQILRTDPRSQRGAATDTQVTVRAGAQGVHVAARVDQSSGSERLRLRDRIAALLARHGFAVNGVRIEAAPRAFSGLREEE